MVSYPLRHYTHEKLFDKLVSGTGMLLHGAACVPEGLVLSPPSKAAGFHPFHSAGPDSLVSHSVGF